MRKHLAVWSAVKLFDTLDFAIDISIVDISVHLDAKSVIDGICSQNPWVVYIPEHLKEFLNQGSSYLAMLEFDEFALFVLGRLVLIRAIALSS